LTILFDVLFALHICTTICCTCYCSARGMWFQTLFELLLNKQLANYMLSHSKMYMLSTQLWNYVGLLKNLEN